MSLPKQVRQQIAEANRIADQMRAAADVPPPPADTVTPAPVVESVAPEEPVAPDEPAPVAAPAPQPVPAEAQYSELLHQYRTLQGIHRKLTNTNSELQSQVQTLQASVQSLTADVERLRQVPVPAPTSSTITDAEIAEFGPDLISVIERKAQQVAAPLNDALNRAKEDVARLAARNTELEQSLSGVSQVQADAAENAFYARLTQLVPDFNALNYDQNFLTWLTQVDPLDPRKQSLQQRLNEAVQLGDAETAASYFTTFKALRVKPVATPPAPKPDLAAQAQPGSRSAPDSTPVQTGRIWTQADIGVFYADVARGKYTPQDKIRVEREIFAAQGANRIAA